MRELHLRLCDHGEPVVLKLTLDNPNAKEPGSDAGLFFSFARQWSPGSATSEDLHVWRAVGPVYDKRTFEELALETVMNTGGSPVMIIQQHFICAWRLARPVIPFGRQDANHVDC